MSKRTVVNVSYVNNGIGQSAVSSHQNNQTAAAIETGLSTIKYAQYDCNPKIKEYIFVPIWYDPRALKYTSQ